MLKVSSASDKLIQTVGSSLLTSSTSVVNLVIDITNIVLSLSKIDILETRSILDQLNDVYTTTIKYPMHSFIEELSKVTTLLGQLQIFFKSSYSPDASQTVLVNSVKVGHSSLANDVSGIAVL